MFDYSHAQYFIESKRHNAAWTARSNGGGPPLLETQNCFLTLARKGVPHRGFNFQTEKRYRRGQPRTEELRTVLQNLNLTPNCAAKGIPTVVPGPKKSPSAPAGMRRSLMLLTGLVTVQAAFRHRAVTLAVLSTGMGRPATSPT